MSLAPLLHLRVRDALLEGRGGGRVDLLSAIKLGADADRPELNAGALHRFLAEAVWYPTALLPSDRLAWSPIDERKALATLTSHGTTVSLEFHFNREGEVAAVYTPQRWARSRPQIRPDALGRALLRLLGIAAACSSPPPARSAGTSTANGRRSGKAASPTRATSSKS